MASRDVLNVTVEGSRYLHNSQRTRYSGDAASATEGPATDLSTRGALHVIGANYVDMRDSVFRFNNASQLVAVSGNAAGGSAFSLDGVRIAVIDSVSFASNRIIGAAGSAMSVFGSTGIILNSTFIGNDATFFVSLRVFLC